MVLSKKAAPVKISIKKPDGTIIKIDLPQEQALPDILQALKGILGVTVRDIPQTNNKDLAGITLMSSESSLVDGLEDMSIMDKIKILIKNAIPLLWFSSHELQELYQHYFSKVPLSTISTYLARLVENGILEKQGSRMKRKYKLIGGALEATPSIDLNRISVVPLH